MVMFKMKEYETVVIEEGEHVAEVTKIDEHIPSKFGDCIRVYYKIVGGDFEGASATAMANESLSPGNKLDLILRALGIELGMGQDFDSNNMIGRKCRIYVETNTKGDKKYNNATKFKALKSAAVTPTAPARPAVTQQPPQGPGTTTVKEPARSATGVATVDEIDFNN